MCLPGNQSHLLPALNFAHRSFWALTILALPAALILRLAFLTRWATDFFPLAFDQRNFWASAILFLPAALIFLRFLGADSAAAPSELRSLLS
jgi:hypothetical protein